jgi:hypothetical protein
MKRTPLRRRAQLRTRAPLNKRTSLKRRTQLTRSPAMAASDAQRAAVAGLPCIACGASSGPIDPAHLLSGEKELWGGSFACLFSCRHAAKARQTRRLGSSASSRY